MTEIMDWEAKARRLDAENEQLRAALQKIASGTWNVQAVRDLNVHEFARRELARGNIAENKAAAAPPRPEPSRPFRWR